MSKEAGSRWLHVELVLRHDQDQPSTRREIREIRQRRAWWRGIGEAEGGGERWRRRRETNAGATCTGAGRTYGRTSGRRWDWVMTAFAPGGRLWTRRSGYSSYSLFLRLRGPAVGTVGHASPSVHSGPASSSASLHDHTAITAHHDPTSAIVLAGIVDSTHLSRSRVLGQLQVFTFRASSVSPSPPPHPSPRPPPPLSYLFLPLLLVLLLFFAVVVLYSRIKRPERLSSLIASQVTLCEALNFGISVFRDSAIASRQCFFSMS